MAYGGLNKYMDAAAELGRNPVSKHQIKPEYGDEQAGGGTGLPKPSRETKVSGTNADRGISIFPVQLTTSRIGNLTRLIHTLALCVTIHTCRITATVVELLLIVGLPCRDIYYN